MAAMAGSRQERRAIKGVRAAEKLKGAAKDAAQDATRKADA
jgi:hypothetical protein